MSKFALFAAPMLAAFFAAAPVLAQSDANPSPSASASPVEPSSAAADTSSPRTQVEAFFQTLIEGRVDAAYDNLLKGTYIARAPKDVEMLKEKTRLAVRTFGDIRDWDHLDTKKVGAHLVRVVGISINANLPIRWRFYFYRAQDQWRLIDIRIDDRLGDMFEEPAPVVLSAPAAPAAPARSPSRQTSR